MKTEQDIREAILALKLAQQADYGTSPEESTSLIQAIDMLSWVVGDPSDFAAFHEKSQQQIREFMVKEFREFDGASTPDLN